MKRKKAIELVDSKIKHFTDFAVSLVELGDSPELMNGLDELETMPEGRSADLLAEEIAETVLEEAGFPTL